MNVHAKSFSPACLEQGTNDYDEEPVEFDGNASDDYDEEGEFEVYEGFNEEEADELEAAIEEEELRLFIKENDFFDEEHDEGSDEQIAQMAVYHEMSDQHEKYDSFNPLRATPDDMVSVFQFCEENKATRVPIVGVISVKRLVAQFYQAGVNPKELFIWIEDGNAKYITWNNKR